MQASSRVGGIVIAPVIAGFSFAGECRNCGLMKFPVLFSLAVLVVLLPTVATAADKSSELVYSAAKYDPKADADADLAKSQQIAKRDGRHILMVVGGDWCPWCRKFADYIEENQTVSTILAKSYVIMKVNVSDETTNTGFLNPYPVIDTYPHLYILDADGKLLRSQSAELLQARSSYREDAMATVLQKFAPKTNDKSN